jgi:type VI secretion system secreted protein Hcp
MPIYMKFEGVDGAVTAAGHEKWIELHSAQMGVSRHISMQTGQGANREPSVPSLSEIVVTKDLDCASAPLLRQSLDGKGKKVSIHFCKTDKDKFEAFLEWELESALLTSFSTSASGGESGSKPMESLSIAFQNIIYSQKKTDKDTKGGANTRTTYDVSKGVAG